MARKNNLKSEASGSIHFDLRTNTVMAEVPHENIKEKVQAVREVVPGKSNNEVVLVLQYYDYNVERAIQAYLEDGAQEALREWNFTGSKPNKKRKNKKKGSGEKLTEKPGSITTAPSSTTATKVDPPPSAAAAAINGKESLPNGDVIHALDQPEVEVPAEEASTVPDSTSTYSISRPDADSVPAAQGDSAAAAIPQPQRQPQNKGRGHGDSHYQLQRSTKERTLSETSTGAGMGDGHHKKPHQGLEKAIKDLHRQTTSLERLRNLLDHEIDRSVKSMKSVFEELRLGLNNREAQLIAEMDVLKKEASEMLEMRQAKASELKRQVDRSDRLKDVEISDLRAEIKHFVSERRHDEDLGRTTRFLFDSDHILDEFKKFGEVVHVKSMYTTRRPSVSSVASSSVSHEGNRDEEVFHSQEVTELQDRLKNTLKLQNSHSRGPTSSKHTSGPQNGPRNDGSRQNRSSQQRDQNSRQPAQSFSGRASSPHSQSLDVNSNKPMASSSLPFAASASSHHQDSNSSYYRDSSSRGPPPSYSSNNTGSPGRGGRGGSGGRGAGRGRGRGDRGGRGGRGSYGGGERSWQHSSQGEGSFRPRSQASNTFSNRPSTAASN